MDDKYDFTSFSDISRQWEAENEKLCAFKATKIPASSRS